ncbi:MAG: 16S rRNA (cytidine(1402)-2'-O)-methyltransferase [Pseudomonadota bacterium]
MRQADESKSDDGANAPRAPGGVATSPLSAGLWLVSTPIGNARDITLRALDVLTNADVLACEDTRVTRKLLEIHGIKLNGRPIIAYNDHSDAARRARIMDWLADGKSVAFASDAGTPMIADPGYRLVEDAMAQGHHVDVAPGPSSVPAAICLAGLPSDRFFFGGFLPQKSGARRAELQRVAAVPATLVFFEAARRLSSALQDITAALGADRNMAVVREMTKKFQEVRRGPAAELAAEYAAGEPPKGEIVLVIGPPNPALLTEDPDIARDLLKAAMTSRSAKDAVREVAQATGLPRRVIYQMSLEINAEGPE